MDWYYSIENERRGPISNDDFHALVAQGVITPDTLVWREGMLGWERHGGNTPPPLPPDAGLPSVVCFHCGKTVPERNSLMLKDRPCCAACKPQVLARINAGEALLSHGAEETRKRYLSHEASVKSIGFLYYLGGAVLFLAGASFVIVALSRSGLGFDVIFGGILGILGVAQFGTAYGVRRLRPWARIPAGILSGIGLLGFPLGTLINGYFLYLLFSKKGSVVFSPEYQVTIAETPHIKYRTPLIVWILLGLLVLALGAAGLTVILSKA